MVSANILEKHFLLGKRDRVKLKLAKCIGNGYKQIRFTPATTKPKYPERESELQAINRILDRRYEVLVELG